LTHVLAQRRNQWRVLHQRALAATQLKRRDDAAADLNSALALQPNDQGAHRDLGSAFSALQLWDEAIECFRLAGERDERDPNSPFLLGNALWEKASYSAALAAYRESSRRNPAHPLPHEVLARELTCCPEVKLRDPPAAVVHATKLVEFKADSIMGWQLLGWARFRAGDAKGSLEALAKSCELEKGGDCGQWIVMALAHEQLSKDTALPEDQQRTHRDQARDWLAKAAAQIDSWKSTPDNRVGQAILSFRQEADELLGTKPNGD
jgi:tetratricopeptide (TPR) repeat protein